MGHGPVLCTYQGVHVRLEVVADGGRVLEVLLLVHTRDGALVTEDKVYLVTPTK